VSVRELEQPPNLAMLYAKAAASGVLSATPLGGRADGLPDEELVVRDLTVDRDHLADYDRVCGFRLSDRLPPTYPHIVAFPLAVELMARRDFPFALPGLVHVGNRITQLRPIATSEQLTLRVSLRDLRPHPKGRQFDAVTEAYVGEEQVWNEASTYLSRGGGDDTAQKPGPDRELPPYVTHQAIWRVPADIGRRYASVSGDRNPIHLSQLTARPFGQPSSIAHGMWTKARCLAAFEGRIPDAFTTDVRFRKPVRLPSKVAFTSHQVDEGVWLFSLTSPDGEHPHLLGELRPDA
jgi:acyl dehydratase